MKSVTELREDALRIKQDAQGENPGEMVRQLEALTPQIEKAHADAVAKGAKTAEVLTPMKLSPATVAELTRLEYHVRLLVNTHTPHITSIAWSY